MNTPKDIESNVHEGVAIIVLRPREIQLLSSPPGEYEQRVVEEYKRRQIATTTTDCIVELHVEKAPSPLVRAISSLYKECSGSGGNLWIVGFPNDEVVTLSTLGLISAPGFQVRRNIEEALREATRSGEITDEQDS